MKYLCILQNCCGSDNCSALDVLRETAPCCMGVDRAHNVTERTGSCEFHHPPTDVHAICGGPAVLDGPGSRPRHAGRYREFPAASRHAALGESRHIRTILNSLQVGVDAVSTTSTFHCLLGKLVFMAQAGSTCRY